MASMSFIEKAIEAGEKIKNSEADLITDIYRNLEDEVTAIVLQGRDLYLLKNHDNHKDRTSFYTVVNQNFGLSETTARERIELWVALAVSQPVVDWKLIEGVPYTKLVIMSKAKDFKDDTQKYVSFAANKNNTLDALRVFVAAEGQANTKSAPHQFFIPKIILPGEAHYNLWTDALALAVKGREPLYESVTRMHAFIRSEALAFSYFKNGKENKGGL
jgi:RNAse (barnase) inhibitor barstar